MKIASWISKRQGYTFRHFETRNKEKYIKDIVDIYNSTWSVFKEDFTPLDPNFSWNHSIRQNLLLMKNSYGLPILMINQLHFSSCYPDLNQILKHLNGKTESMEHDAFCILQNDTSDDKAQGSCWRCSSFISEQRS